MSHLSRRMLVLGGSIATLILLLVTFACIALHDAKIEAKSSVDAELSRLGGSSHYREMRISRHHGLTLVYDLHGTPELNLAIYRWLPEGEVILSK